MHIPEYIENGKLLDIGCSWGSYLYKMQQYGWDVHGTEINSKAVNFAREELDLKNVKSAFFEDIEWEENFFDVVHMSMVLEHFYDPLKSLLLIHSIMKPRGQLILSVPDISGFEIRLYKNKCYTVQVPQHLSHFSPETITNFLEKSGFIVKKIIHHRFDRDLVASAGNLENQLPGKLLHAPVLRKTVVRSFITLLSLLGKTSRMSVFARKISA